MLRVETFQHPNFEIPGVPQFDGCLPSGGGEVYPGVFQALTYGTGMESQNIPIHWTRPNPGLARGTGVQSDGEDDEGPLTPPPPRERLSYTRYQLELLNAIYLQVRYPNSTQKLLIAKRVGISREQVKIWFQNRRRKDVVGGPKSKNSDKAKSNGKNYSDIDMGNSSMVPTSVLKSVIAELLRFEQEPLKTKKSKKKVSTIKTLTKTVNGVPPSDSSALLDSYDMVSPPNQVTPSAFLNSAVNRFHHSTGTSAFENPRNSGVSKNNQDGGANMGIFGGYSTFDSTPQNGQFGYSSLPNKSSPEIGSSARTETGGLHYDIPVLSDLLMTKPNVHLSVSRQIDTQEHPSPGGFSSNTHIYNGSFQTPADKPSLRVNRVFPFPFVADSPVKLSSIKHVDHYRTTNYSKCYSDDSFQPLRISSLTNPYYSHSTCSWNFASDSLTYTAL